MAKKYHCKILTGLAVLITAWPQNLYALQLHAGSEGIITHQIGHLFFLFSMVVLMLIISDKGLDSHKGWRLIQMSAFFFILWNLCAIAAHFMDNQIYAVSVERLSRSYARINVLNNSSSLAWVYYGLKLDHLLCVPAMICLYKGLSCLVEEERAWKKEPVHHKDGSA